jgi:prephenate dehydrogenase
VFSSIAIVGFGLIGGSVALAVREQWPATTIVAIDREPIVEAARRMSAADVGGSDFALAADAELVILAAPVRQNIALLERVAACPGARAIVTDVGSTKGAMIDAARRFAGAIRFVGGHPLAGAATGGLESARADLFQGRPWILTPEIDTPSTDTERVSALASSLGAIPTSMDAADHDRLMAYVSHLPQMAVSALMHVVGQQAGRDGLAFAGTGLRDTTRLAASPAATWRDIAGTNASAVATAIDDLIATLELLKADLTTGDELQRIFDAAGRWKNAIE